MVQQKLHGSVAGLAALRLPEPECFTRKRVDRPAALTGDTLFGLSTDEPSSRDDRSLAAKRQPDYVGVERFVATRNQ